MKIQKKVLQIILGVRQNELYIYSFDFDNYRVQSPV
jgi:hypothetical protein